MLYRSLILVRKLGRPLYTVFTLMQYGKGYMVGAQSAHIYSGILCIYVYLYNRSLCKRAGKSKFKAPDEVTENGTILLREPTETAAATYYSLYYRKKLRAV